MKDAEKSRRVLVIGASGNQGAGVVRHCAAAGIEVYAFTRDPSSPAAQKLQNPARHQDLGTEQPRGETSYRGSTHQEKGGVHLVQGDLNDADSLLRAAHGMDAVFFFTMPGDAKAEHLQAQNVLDAVRASGSVSMVIYSSAAGTDRCDSFPGRGASNPMEQYWLGKQGNEALVRQLSDDTSSTRKINWVIVRPAAFLQCFVPPISTYLFPRLYAKDRPLLRVAYRSETQLELIDAADVGLVVARAITRPMDWAGKAVSLVIGRFTIQEIADIISKLAIKGMPMDESSERVKVNIEYVSFEELQAERGSQIAYPQRLINEIKHYISPDGAKDDVVKELPLTGVEDFFILKGVSANRADPRLLQRSS